MKFFIFYILFVTACSKNAQNNIKEIQEPDQIISLSELDINSVLESGQNKLPAQSSPVDFGAIEKGQLVEQDIIIKNNQSSDLVFSSSDVNSSQIAPFQMVSNSCVSVTLKRGKNCALKLRLSNLTELTESVDLSKSLVIKNVSLNLTGTQLLFQAPPLIPVTGYIVGPLHLDFGTMKSGEAKSLTVIINNKNASSSAFSMPAISNPKVSAINSCPATILGRKSCSIKFTYTASSDETIVEENIIFLFNNQLKHSVVIESNIPLPVPSIVPVSPPVSLSLYQPGTATGVIQFVNNGISTLPGPITAVSSNAGITLFPPTCSGGLSRSKTCSVSYSINSALFPGGISVQTVKLQSGIAASESFSLNLNVTQNTLPCALSDVQANGVSVLNSNSSLVGNKTGADVSQCLLASDACNQYYSLATDSKSCQAVSSACLPADAQANGWNTSQALTFAGSRAGVDISSCAIATCNTNYAITGKDCTAIACTQANSGIANVLTVSGTKVSGCVAESCISGYESDTGSCVEISSAIGAKVVFAAFTEESGRELWQYNPNAPVGSQVSMVEDLRPGVEHGVPGHIGVSPWSDNLRYGGTIKKAGTQVGLLIRDPQNPVTYPGSFTSGTLGVYDSESGLISRIQTRDAIELNGFGSSKDIIFGQLQSTPFNGFYWSGIDLNTGVVGLLRTQQGHQVFKEGHIAAEIGGNIFVCGTLINQTTYPVGWFKYSPETGYLTQSGVTGLCPRDSQTDKSYAIVGNSIYYMHQASELKKFTESVGVSNVTPPAGNIFTGLFLRNVFKNKIIGRGYNISAGAYNTFLHDTITGQTSFIPGVLPSTSDYQKNENSIIFGDKIFFESGVANGVQTSTNRISVIDSNLNHSFISPTDLSVQSPTFLELNGELFVGLRGGLIYKYVNGSFVPVGSVISDSAIVKGGDFIYFTGSQNNQNGFFSFNPQSGKFKMIKSFNSSTQTVLDIVAL